MSTKQYPSIEYIRQCLRYEDGRLFWISRPASHFKNEHGANIWRSQCLGKEAGCLRIDKKSGDRRWQIVVDYRRLFRFRIVWAMHHDEWVIGLDHKNRNSLDDRIDNLRPATQSQNRANSIRSTSNKSGYKGVDWHVSTGKWRATITISGKQKHLGLFGDPADAHAAYTKAAMEHYGEFAHDGT